MHPFKLIVFENLPIFEQLQLEEALLRTDDRNWCLINYGSPPAIVMGISGRPSELIENSAMQRAPLPLIRRFSGGGTVIVDQATYFYTLIGNRSCLDFPCYPERLLRWTEQLYAAAFAEMSFSVQGQDYTLGNRKFGGNAQYITKTRWLHHSSFLWSYRKEMMEYLLIPPKVPTYRNERTHEDFLCCLKDHFSDSEAFKLSILRAFGMQFDLEEIHPESLRESLAREHRRSTVLVEWERINCS